jgi:HAD superfamily hydrolase (TIGR01549 family)
MVTPMCAIVFDLDETLLDTSLLREDRANRRWGRLGERLDEVVAYSDDDSTLQAADLAAHVKALGFRVGVLTHAPRWYAERLLDAFEIPYDALITGSDGYPQKPDPTSLIAIARELDVPATECVMVGDDAADIGAGQNAGALTVGVAWSRSAPAAWRRCWPDIAVNRPDRVIDAIENGAPRMAYAEAALAGIQPLWHWGSLLRLGDHVYGAGRYFATTDARHPSSVLSRVIIRAKEHPDGAEKLGAVIAGLTETAWTGTDVDLVTSVPPKPGQEYDRFAAIRSALADAAQTAETGEVLTQLRNDEDYKHRPADERPQRTAGRFHAERLEGERVLLLDDVITSGGQAEECRRMMLANGARSVKILAFGVTQDRLPRECPDCGGLLRLVTSGYRPFVGCSNHYRTGCRYQEQAPQI